MNKLISAVARIDKFPVVLLAIRVGQNKLQRLAEAAIAAGSIAIQIKARGLQCIGKRKQRL